MTEANEAFERHVSEFWTNQDKILDSMQAVTDGWFARRHVGTHAALEAAQRMCRATSATELFLEYQTWTMGAWERIMADAVAAQGCGIAVQRLMGESLAQSTEGDAANITGDAQAHIVVPSVPEAAPADIPAVQPPPVRRTAGTRAASSP